MLASFIYLKCMLLPISFSKPILYNSSSDTTQNNAHLEHRDIYKRDISFHHSFPSRSNQFSIGNTSLKGLSTNKRACSVLPLGNTDLFRDGAFHVVMPSRLRPSCRADFVSFRRLSSRENGSSSPSSTESSQTRCRSLSFSLFS